MKYKLLSNGTGVHLSRDFVATNDELTLVFEGAPNGTTAVFKNNAGDVFYRTLDAEGECKVHPGLITDVCKVSVAALDIKVSSKRWKCEALTSRYVLTEDGKGIYIVSPDNGSLPSDVTELKLKLDAVTERLSAAEEKYSALKERIDHIYNGYDFT